MTSLSDEEHAWLEEKILETIQSARLGRSCLACESFIEATEICQLANARPPARTIATGCSKFFPEIPF